MEIQEASITGVIRTIAIIVLIYYTFKIIRIYVLPLLLKYFFKKVEKNMQQQYSNARPQGRVVKDDGKVKITVNPTQQHKSTTSSTDNDEYVDFEEVK